MYPSSSGSKSTKMTVITPQFGELTAKNGDKDLKKSALIPKNKRLGGNMGKFSQEVAVYW